MKSTGIVRRVDELGRVVLPKEIRRTFDINEKDPLEIFIEDEKVILKKHKANMASHLSGEIAEDNLSLANGKLILTPEEANQLVSDIQSRLNK